MNIEERIEAAAAALVRGEDASWELARLTWESTNEHGHRKQLGRVTMEEWCQRIRERTGRKFSKGTGVRYRQIWSQHMHRDVSVRPSWTDAYEATMGVSLEDRNISRPGALAEASPEAKRRMLHHLTEDGGPELKRELIEHLAEDPDVQGDWQTRARVQRAIHQGDQRQEEKRQEFIERDPMARKFEGRRAAIDLSVAVGQVSVQNEQLRQEMEEALLRDPSEITTGIGMLQVSLPRARKAIRDMDEMLDRIEQFSRTGKTDIDAFLSDVLKSGA